MPDVSKILELHAASTHGGSQGAIPAYSDIAQRYCDRKLLAQQSVVADGLKKKGERKIVETPWVKKDGSPKRLRDAPLWRCPPPPRTPASRNRSKSPPDIAKTPLPASSSPLLAIEDGQRKANVDDDAGRVPFASEQSPLVEVPVPAQHDKDVSQAVAERRRRRSAPNPVLPSELLPQLMPGVRRELLSAATRRARRANQRRKDALKLLKAAEASKKDAAVANSTSGASQQQTVDMFDRAPSPAVTDASALTGDLPARDEDDERPWLFRGKPIVVTSVDPTLINENDIECSVLDATRMGDEITRPGHVRSFESGGDSFPDEDNDGGRRSSASTTTPLDPATPVQTLVPPPVTRPSPALEMKMRKQDAPLRSRTLPETHTFLHEVRMKRQQQASWEPVNSWDHPERHKHTPAGPMKLLLPLKNLRPDTAGSSSNHGGMPPGGFKTKLNLAILQQQGANDGGGADEFDDVRSLPEAPRRGPSRLAQSAGDVEMELRSEASYTAPEILRGRGRSRSPTQQSVNPSPVFSLRPGESVAAASRQGGGTDLSDSDDNGAVEESALRRRSSSGGGLRSPSQDDDDDEDDRLLSLTLPKRRLTLSVDADATQSYTAKPFTLPATFLRYKSSAVTAAASTDTTTQSTPPNAALVKLVWGSVPSSAQPSAVARSSEHMLVVELVFKAPFHHFDARHIRSLLGPHARDVTDMEAGNRGGNFLALYGNSRLQLLKGIASLMTKIEKGESYLFEQAFSAPRANVESSMLVESPRDLDDLPTGEKVLPRKKDAAQAGTTLDSWFSKHAVATEAVNVHAPGALEMFMVQQAKKKEQERRKKRAKATVKASALAGGGDSTVVEPVKSLFIAEGDDVPLALIQMQQQEAAALAASPAEEAVDLAVGSKSDQGQPDGSSSPFGVFTSTTSAIFTASPSNARYMQLNQELSLKLEKARGSIIELLADSDLSLEDLRKARARQILEGTSSSSFMPKSLGSPIGSPIKAKLPRPVRRLTSRNLRRIRDEELFGDSMRRPSFHQLAQEFLGNSITEHQQGTSDNDDAKSVSSPSGKNAQKKGGKRTKKSASFVESVDEAAKKLGSPADHPHGDIMSPLEEQRAKLEAATRKAVEQLEAFVQTHAVYDRIAIIVPMTEFRDPTILPTPMVEHDAEDLCFLLQQLDYHAIVMMPPEELRDPTELDDDASQAEIDLYKEKLRRQEEQWFLIPTAENIGKLVEALLYRNSGGFHCNVALIMLTRGYIGTPDSLPHPSARYSRNDTQVALTFDTAMNKISRSTVLVASDLISACRQSCNGRQPMIFIDTWPVYENPNSDAQVQLEHQIYQEQHTNIVGNNNKAKKDAPLASTSFLYFSGMPEDGGDTMSALYPRHVGGLGTYYLKRALEGRALPPNQLKLSMSSLIFYMSTKLQARQCRVAHNAAGAKSHTMQRPYFDFSVIYDSQQEVRDAHRDSHEIEISGMLRINLQLQVKIDMGYYSHKDLSFLPRSEHWWKNLRRDLHKLLYPKSSKAADPSQVVLKPRQQRADRLRFCCMVPSNTSVSVEYPSIVDTIVDDRKLRFLEKDYAKIADRCWAIQEGKGHGYSFAGVPPPPPPIVLRPISDFESAGASSMRRIMTMSRKSASYFNPVMQQMRRLVPLEVHYPLSSGFVEVIIDGQQRRQQQDFIIQYAHAGCAKQTSVGATPVTLNRRPGGIYGTVLLTVLGTRRDARKLDRFVRQQPFRSSLGIVCERVELDPFEPHEHLAALRIQRRYRGHVVRRVLDAQRRITEDEGEERNDIFTDEDIEFEEFVEAALLERNKLVQKWELQDRQEISWMEHDQRLYLLETALRYLVLQQDRGRRRILVEEVVSLLPLAEGTERVAIDYERMVGLARLGVLSHFTIGMLWDHFYLETDYYQEVLRYRNACREQSRGKVTFGYLMPRPEPPCSIMDLGFSVIRSIVDEQAHTARRQSPPGRSQK